MNIKTCLWQAQDLLKIDREALRDIELPEWFSSPADSFLAVVRRDFSSEGKVPIGLRGSSRGERFGIFINSEFILERTRPEELPERLRAFPIRDSRIDFLTRLAERSFPFQWGITGSIAYSLLTGEKHWKESSDIDLRIYLPKKVSRDFFDDWLQALSQSPVRIDTQIETPLGGFALKEWLKADSVLLRTDRGPFITNNAWSQT